ncbi:MAG: PDZ domain-containing protein [Methylocapsa sp.]|nr:PDZ domain-containing protein [Methylocapsa sp.]
MIAISITAAGALGYYYLASAEKPAQSQIQATAPANPPLVQSAPKPSLAAPAAKSQNSPLAPADPAIAPLGWIGVQIQELNQEAATKLGRKAANGALVSGLFENAPAFAAGIKLGDVILAINGTPVNGPSDVVQKVQALGPGNIANLVLWRRGSEETLQVMVGPSLPAGRERHAINYANGDRYEGEIFFGQYSGRGTLTYANGDRYDGEFRNGKFFGYGEYISANGRRSKGEWRDGELVRRHR